MEARTCKGVDELWPCNEVCCPICHAWSLSDSDGRYEEKIEYPPYDVGHFYGTYVRKRVITFRVPQSCHNCGYEFDNAHEVIFKD